MAWGIIPRSDFRDRPPPLLDDQLPAFVLKIGSYPIHHGGLAVIRSLGRAGVAVSAVTEDRRTPAAVSRYLDEAIVWRTTGAEDQEVLLDRLVQIGARRCSKPLLICTDDEAAVLAAEGRDVLERYFVLPQVPAPLPRTLASKRGLYELCRRHGVPTPRTQFPTTASELNTAAEALGFPFVLKNIDPFVRLYRTPVTRTTLVSTPAALDELSAGWDEPFSVLAQQYLPTDTSVDWIVHGYCGADADLRKVFTGLKLRSAPQFANATALGQVATNEELISLTTGFCRQIGYQGVFDLDWRRDTRDGTFYLVDFNPRVGAQFRLFEDDAGVDVVRAMHLDLSGRPIPAGRPVEGDRLVVENLELAASLARGWSPSRRIPLLDALKAPTRPRAAWIARDDPLPSVALVLRQAVWSLRGVRTLATKRVRPEGASGH